MVQDPAVHGAEVCADHPDETAAMLEEAARLAPDDGVIQMRLGIALRTARRLLRGRNAFRRAIELQPELAPAHHGLASCLLAMARPADALPHIQRAAELDPGDAKIQNDLGGVLMSLGRADEAAEAFERAAELRPGWDVPLQNLATVAFRTGRTERVPELIRRAEESGTALPRARMVNSMRLLEKGEYAEGWREYEWRWPNGGKPLARPELVVPLWDGSPLGDRNLLLWTEQGYGDTLQFIRFASLIQRERGRVVVHAPKPLARVVATCPGVDQVVVDGDSVDVDLQFPLMSLPHVLNAAPSPIPPYLFPLEPCPDAEQAIERGSALNVGILWASGRYYPNHASRDCPLELFAELASIPGVRLYSLQHGDPASELATCPAPIIDLSPILGDFHKTAAFVKRLDLVITVDTSLAHLAGAVGAHTWTLICHAPDWRWMRGRDDSPWYATMRLYRQEKAGNWRPVMERIAADLRALARDHGAAQAGADVASPAPAVPVSRTTPRPMGRVFIKQYGEQRTGTNYIRAVLLRNYPDAEPLVHILGDKHQPPAPLDDVRRETASDPDPALAFVATATFGVPANETQPSNRDQLTAMVRVARPLLEAYHRGELRYVVSIKDPYAWAVSMARAHRVVLGSMDLPAHYAPLLRPLCRRFNRSYAAWLQLAETHPDATFVIGYEDLLRDPAAVFARMEAHFCLERAEAEWQDIRATVLPTYWDGWGVAKADSIFDRDAHLEKRYLAQLGPLHRQIVTETIDWSLCARFGYAPLTD